MLKLTNTLTRKKEEFKPLQSGKIGMYSCGPTVYDHAHLGHARKYTNDDMLRRTLEYLGYSVKHVMNVTDVGHLMNANKRDRIKILKNQMNSVLKLNQQDSALKILPAVQRFPEDKELNIFGVQFSTV